MISENQLYKMHYTSIKPLNLQGIIAEEEIFFFPSIIVLKYSMDTVKMQQSQEPTGFLQDCGHLHAVVSYVQTGDSLLVLL